jgi:hypothetical protein
MSEQHVTVKLTLSSLSRGRYRSRIEESPAGASRGSGTNFKLPDKPEQGYAQFLKEVDGGKRPETELSDLGKLLYAGLFKGEVGKAFLAARAVAQSREAFLRLAISVLSPELAEIPWEFLHDGDNYLIGQPKTHIVRILDVLPPEMAPFRPFRKLLLVVANPAGPARFDSDKHVERLGEELEKMGALSIPVLSATRKKLQREIEEQKFDAFYFLGHGEFQSNGGQILLEDKDGNAEPLPASTLAQWLSASRQKISFAYFNSCSTGVTDHRSTFAGVAQRILADGKIPAVIGQQAPVLASQSMEIAEAFLRRVHRGDSPEKAIAAARSVAKGVTWGIPVLYTHLRGAEEFERNRLECLLDADRQSKFVLSLPTFRMGVLRQDSLKGLVKVTVDPPNSYKYRGDTHPLTATMAAWEIMGLLIKIVPKEQIQLIPADAETSGGETHHFFIGSRSHQRVANLLTSYEAKLRFQFGSEWVLNDIEYGREYRVPDLSQLPSGEYESLTDYGIIEKIIDGKGRRVFFVIAGFGDRATRGCAWYLAERWTDILKKHVQGEFSLILKFPGGQPFYYGEEVDRASGGTAVTA